jgi:creatinine amidohydrolase
VLKNLLDGLESQGFRRIAIINGHGGNMPVAGSSASGSASRARSLCR